MRVRASASEKLMGRNFGFFSNPSRIGELGEKLRNTASIDPSLNASAARCGVRFTSVVFSDVTPPTSRIFCDTIRVPLPSGPTAIRLPLSSVRSFNVSSA